MSLRIVSISPEIRLHRFSTKVLGKKVAAIRFTLPKNESSFTWYPWPNDISAAFINDGKYLTNARHKTTIYNRTNNESFHNNVRYSIESMINYTNLLRDQNNLSTELTENVVCVVDFLQTRWHNWTSPKGKDLNKKSPIKDLNLEKGSAYWMTGDNKRLFVCYKVENGPMSSIEFPRGICLTNEEFNKNYVFHIPDCPLSSQFMINRIPNLDNKNHSQENLNSIRNAVDWLANYSDHFLDNHHELWEEYLDWTKPRTIYSFHSVL